MQGWISLHRKLVEWEWYSDANTMRLFVHCLLKANHVDKKWRGIDISRGQFLTSINSLSRELRLSSQKIRTSISKLKSTGEITIKTTSKYSMISITCYDSYQGDNKLENKQATNKQQTNNKQITTTNNDNNDNNDNKMKNKRFSPPSENEVTDFMLSLNWPNDNGATARAMIDYYAQQGWKLSNGNMMKDWNAAARGWLRNQQKWDAKK